MLTTNGGQAVPDVAFSILKGKHQVMLGALYGIADKESNLDLETNYIEFEEENTDDDGNVDIPDGIIPIGDDPGGNQLLLITEGKDTEKVYFLDRVGIISAQEDDVEMFYIADDIDQFIKSLKVIPED